MEHRNDYLKPEVAEIPIAENFLEFREWVGENKDFFSRTTLENSTMNLIVPNEKPFPWVYD